MVPPAVALVPVLLGFRILEPLDWRLSFLAVVVADCRFGIGVAGLWLLLEAKKKSFQLGVSEPLASSMFD